MDVPVAERFDRRFWLWWAVSIVLVYVLQGVLPFALDIPVALWTDPEWLFAIAAYGVTLAAMMFALRRRLGYFARVVWAAATATFVYLIAPSVAWLIMSSMTAEEFVSGWPLYVGLGFLLLGNGWVAFLVPVLAAIPLRGRKPSGRYPARAGY